MELQSEFLILEFDIWKIWNWLYTLEEAESIFISLIVHTIGKKQNSMHHHFLGSFSAAIYCASKENDLT